MTTCVLVSNCSNPDVPTNFTKVKFNCFNMSGNCFPTGERLSYLFNQS